MTSPERAMARGRSTVKGPEVKSLGLVGKETRGPLRRPQAREISPHERTCAVSWAAVILYHKPGGSCDSERVSCPGGQQTNNHEAHKQLQCAECPQAIRGRCPLSDVPRRVWYHPTWTERGFPGDPVHGDARLRGAEIRWSRGRRQLPSQG